MLQPLPVGELCAGQWSGSSGSLAAEKVEQKVAGSNLLEIRDISICVVHTSYLSDSGHEWKLPVEAAAVIDFNCYLCVKNLANWPILKSIEKDCDLISQLL